MADLNVQPKRKAPIWPWLLLILAIAAVAYFILRENDVVSDGIGTDSTSINRTDTVNQYRTDTATSYRADTLRTDTLAR